MTNRRGIVVGALVAIAGHGIALFFGGIADSPPRALVSIPIEVALSSVPIPTTQAVPILPPSNPPRTSAAKPSATITESVEMQPTEPQSTDPTEIADEPSAEAAAVPLISPDDPGDLSAQVASSTVDWSPWQALVRSRIEAAKVYPYASRNLGQQGAVTVEFFLSGQGDLVGTPKVATSSGIRRLDQAAIAAVLAAQPFPAGPAETSAMRITLDFRLR